MWHVPLCRLRLQMALSESLTWTRLRARLSRATLIPGDSQVVQVVPRSFRTAFHTRLTRQVEVRPPVLGNFAPGLRISRVVAHPAVIAITGPRQRVEAVETAMTDPIDATGDVDRATFTSQAYVSDPLIQVVHPGPIRVTVIMEKAPSSSGGL